MEARDEANRPDFDDRLGGGVRLRRRRSRPTSRPRRRLPAEAQCPLKDAKLNIEHNATDRDTGFQGFVDSEGWRRLEVRGPEGKVLGVRGAGIARRPGPDRALLRDGRARERGRSDPADAREATGGALHGSPGPDRRTARPRVRPPAERGSPTTSPRGRSWSRSAEGATVPTDGDRRPTGSPCRRRSPASRRRSSPTS